MSPSSASTSLTKHRGANNMSSSSAHREQPANTGTAPNIWQMMNYPIPRGRCKHKPSLLAAGCPCLRFMLNPIQAASTYTCDGCGHHASFHVLKNDEDGDADFVAPPHQVAGVKRREIVDLSEDDDEEYNDEGTEVGGGRRLNGSHDHVNGNGKRIKRLTNGSTESPDRGVGRGSVGSREKATAGAAVKRARAS